jgi:hypothetical protein
MALNTGFRAGLAAYQQRAMLASEFYDEEWAEPKHRLLRYAINEAYWGNTAYSDIHQFSKGLKDKGDLYHSIRGIYNPVNRLVESYVSKIYGGALDTKEAREGAIPIDTENEALYEAIAQLWVWSNWRTHKSRYVRYGANLGDAFLKIVDDTQRGQVRLEVIHPSRIVGLETNAVGEIVMAHIEYERSEDPNDKNAPRYMYGEIIKRDEWVTLKNGSLFAYPENLLNGNPVAEWRNPYGFVPMQHVQHVDMGLGWGASAYHSQRPKIDELNDAASILNDQIRKAINPIWYIAGAQTQSPTMPKSTRADDRERRDTLPLLTGPEGSQPFAMVANIDIAGASQNILNLQAELERDAPELALHRVRESGMSGVAVKNSYSDAIDRYTEAMGNYDDALIRAQRMAIAVAAFRRYSGFEGFPADPNDDALDHNIKERPIFDDRLSVQEEIQALISANSLQPGLQRVLLEKLGYDEAQVSEIINGSLTSLQTTPVEGGAIRDRKSVV